MNNTPKSIMFKLCALFSFIVFGAGCFIAFYGYSVNTSLFIAGIIVAVVGFYATAVFAVYVGKYNGERDLHDITLFKAFKAAFMVSFLGSASRVTYRFNIKVEGHTAIAFVERNSHAYEKYVKNKSREVKVKFNPEKPQYCMVLE